MTRKKNDSNGSYKQLDLPFDSIDSSTNKKFQDNIIQFFPKTEEIQIKKENYIRKRSIKRLVNHANTLKW